MRPMASLAAALTCAALAVGLVSADLAFNVVVTVEVRAEDGSWTPVATSAPSRDRYALHGQPCVGREFRVTLENDAPWGTTRHMHIGYRAASGRETFVVDEAWSLAAGQSRSHEFTVPESAFNSTAPDRDGKPMPVAIGVEVVVFQEERYGEGSATAYCQLGAPAEVARA